MRANLSFLETITEPKARHLWEQRPFLLQPGRVSDDPFLLTLV
jgi:hypothetical protein